MRYQFCFLPEIDGFPFASITGQAEIVTAAATVRNPDPGWWIGRLFVDRIGTEPAEITDAHWLYQPLKLWLLQSETQAIHAEWAKSIEAVPA